jgi:hypothetical protein
MFKNKASVYILLTLFIIIGAIAFNALYSKSNLPLASDNISRTYSDDPVDDGFGQIAGAGEGSDVTVAAASSIPTEVSSGIKAFVYMDANNNKIFDPKEEVCTYCLAKQLLCSKSSLGRLAKVANLVAIDIQDKGVVPTEKLLTGNVCWGAYTDRKILIEDYQVKEIGDGIPEIAVPAYYVNAVTDANNAYFKALGPETNGEMVYTFSTLIPAVKTKYTNSSSLWIKFTPNIEKLDYYFLAPAKVVLDKDGSVTGSKGMYYIKIKWNFSEDYPTILNDANYELVM